MEKKHFVQLIGNRAHLLKGHIRKLGCDIEVIDSPEELSSKADICIASGVYYIIESKYLQIPRLGIWGFHESALPRGRGFAPIHWTVLKGEKELTVSFFRLTKEVDGGELLGQEKCMIPETALLEDLRTLAFTLSKELIDKYLTGYIDGKIQPCEQKGEPTYYRKRTPDDARLDTSKSLKDLWSLIRICDNEEYPAWFEIEGKKFILKRYRKE